MASESRVNLIEEFEEQEDNDFIVLTTFGFDPAFFDTYLLDKLQRQNPYAEIFVLMDSTTFHSKYDEFTSQTGTKYHILPVEIQNGFFHPKVHVFFSEGDKEADLYVSSANLTLQGFTNNIESVVKFDYDVSSGVPQPLEDVVRFFEIISEEAARDSEFQDYLDDIRDSRLMGEEVAEEASTEFFSNQRRPIIDQLAEEVEGNGFDEIVLSAPFVSDNPQIVSRIHENVDLDTVTLILQRDNHNLDKLEDYQEFCNSNDLGLQVKELVSEENRFLHAKTLVLKGEGGDYGLIGSPNLTASALLETWDSGNCEASVLLKNADIDFPTGFDVETVSDLEEFLSESSTEISREPYSNLRIHSVEFLEVSKELKVRTENREGEGKVQITTRNPANQVVDSIDLSKEENVFQVNEGTPVEVEVYHEGDVGRRRVFFDEDIFQKRARRTSASLQEISDSLDNRPDLRLDELVVVYRNLGLSIDDEGDDEDSGSSSGSGSGGGRDGDKYLPPSRGGGGTGGIDSILRKLTQVYDSVKAKKTREREVEDLYEEEGDEQDIPSERVTSRELIEKEKVGKKMKRFLRKSNNLLLEVSEDSENPIDAWLDAQHFLLMNFLIFYGILEFSEDVFEHLEETLGDNLSNFEDIKKIDDEFEFETKRRFFTYIVIYNLVNRSLGREEYTPRAGTSSFMRNVYDNQRLMSEEFYMEVRETAEQFCESKLHELEFKPGEFRKAYANLAVGTIGPKTMRDDIYNICKLISEESDHDIRSMYTYFLRRQVDRWSIHPDLKERVREISLPDDAEAREAIEYLLNKEYHGLV